MGIRFFGWVARRRVAVLIAALVLAVALQVLVGNDHRLELGFVVAVLSMVVLGLLAAVAGRIHRPAILVARPEIPAFERPANPAAVLGAAAYTSFAVYMMGSAVRDVADDTDLWFGAVLVVVLLTGLSVQWLTALGRFGVRLTPEGILDRQPLGSLRVPWDALATPRAALPRDSQRVRLYFARPELVGKRGLRLGDPTLLPAPGIEAEFLARAIHEYANRPDLRPTVGSEAALAGFREIPQVAALTS
ncbi:hypothetical protein [Actinoplanes sp. HUAS TT8]|uniref:hypothetical protein n=1 Tax=Actinoplanes sp. HUAS TT8 TaxID=3447453 RepID=UPI003F5290DF